MVEHERLADDTSAARSGSSRHDLPVSVRGCAAGWRFRARAKVPNEDALDDDLMAIFLPPCAPTTHTRLASTARRREHWAQYPCARCLARVWQVSARCSRAHISCGINFPVLYTLLAVHLHCLLGCVRAVEPASREPLSLSTRQRAPNWFRRVPSGYIVSGCAQMLPRPSSSLEPMATCQCGHFGAVKATEGKGEREKREAPPLTPHNVSEKASQLNLQQRQRPTRSSQQTA